MGFTVNWLNPGRLLRIRVEGTTTDDDLAQLREQVRHALAETPERLDYLLDLGQSAPPGHASDRVLRFLLDKYGFLRSPKTGRLFVIQASDNQRLILNSVALALRLEVFFFDDEASALKFVAELTP